MIEIREVKGKREIKLFASYPIKLFKNCPYYVPSLRSDEINTFDERKNFALKGKDIKGFLCYKNGELSGRILAIIDYLDNEKTGKKYVRFSRFECIDDKEVFNALIGAVEKYGKENGMQIIHGPWGFNDTDREGLLTFGYDERSTYATNYSYPYFAERLREMGFNDESKWIERRFTIPNEPYERVVNLAEKLKTRLNVKEVAYGPMKKLVKKYGDSWFETYNEAYHDLDGFVPIEGEAKKNVLKQFATIINTRYFSLVVDKNDRVVAFGVVLPSICNALIKHKGKLFPIGFIDLLKSIKKPKELEMALIGVRKEYKNTGINTILIAKIMKNVINDKIVNIESNPMLETNDDIQYMWKFAENKIVKRRQTFVRNIEG